MGCSSSTLDKGSNTKLKPSGPTKLEVSEDRPRGYINRQNRMTFSKKNQSPEKDVNPFEIKKEKPHQSQIQPMQVQFTVEQNMSIEQ